MKPTRPNTQQQQPFTQQLAQQTKGQPMFMPHSNVPNDLQKNTNQRIPLGFPVNMMPPPPHLNVQTPQMHQNLTRMPLTNFNVSFLFPFFWCVFLLKRSISISSDSIFFHCSCTGEFNAYCYSNNADNSDASETNATITSNDATTARHTNTDIRAASFTAQTRRSYYIASTHANATISIGSSAIGYYFCCLII